jgi:hypothetical protein
MERTVYVLQPAQPCHLQTRIEAMQEFTKRVSAQSPNSGDV